MNRWMWCGLALVVLGCGGDSTGSSGLNADDVSGVWDMNSTGCLAGDLPVRLSATSSGALTSAVNAWTNQSAGVVFDRPLDGSVTLSSGAAEFHLFADGDKDAAVLFTGTVTSNGTLNGTFTDPMPGFDPIFHLSGQPTCISTVSGTKR